jgi:mono/diheme cytochrome c family protein
VLSFLDRFSGWLTWVAAGLVVVMLVVGPKLGVAQDKNNPSPTEAAGMRAYASSGGGGVAKRDGKTLFTGNCGSCHTLSKAGTSGQVGPSLDGTQLNVAAIERQVRDGGGSMPSFKGKLSDAEIKAVAAYVAASR